MKTLTTGCLSLLGLAFFFLIATMITQLIRTSGHASSFNPTIIDYLGGGLILALILVVGVLRVNPTTGRKVKVKTPDEKSEAAEQAEARRLIRQATYGEITPHVPADVMLKATEICYWTDNAQLWTHHTHTSTTGGSLGASFRVRKGLWIRPGAFQSASSKDTVLEADDSGPIHVTNERLLFVGARSAREIPISTIASLTPMTDGLRVSQLTKPVVFFVTGNPLLGIVVPRIVSGKVSRQKKPSA